VDKHEFFGLIEKYLKGQASPEEEQLLLNFFDSFQNEDPRDEKQLGVKQELEDKMLARLITATTEKTTAPVRRLWPRVVAAASILLALSFGGYFLLHKTKPVQQTAQNRKPDILPGTNQATLTLANGQKIILSKGLNGRIATQGNMVIQVNNGNAISYIAATNVSNGPVAYNTISTVRGQESPYPLVLADGTKVWLNAASSITYPVAFNGKDRSVKITGEAYFEVSHNAAQPFRVMVKGQTIEDIGTAFNVNAYDDEPEMRTTLISGSIKIGNKILRPGQAAVIKAGSDQIEIREADTEQAMAWKNGYFLFDNENLESIMRKVSRWYNVDIEYPQGQRITETFGGSITRYSNVSKVLNMLEITGDYQFRVDGRKIIISKKQTGL
jgi:transmembrane sensor